MAVVTKRGWEELKKEHKREREKTKEREKRKEKEKLSGYNPNSCQDIGSWDSERVCKVRDVKLSTLE